MAGQIKTRSSTKAWLGYGGNAQHDAVSPSASSKLTEVVWSTSLDDDRSYYGDVVFIHYASPCVSATNTLVHGFRFNKTVNGATTRDNWRVYGRSGKDGKEMWRLDTDYSAPALFPSAWTSVYPLALAMPDTVAAAGGGGTVIFRPANTKGGMVVRRNFYSHYAKYEAAPSRFAGIKICTPLTPDGNGNVYFGYVVTGQYSGALGDAIGTGGIAKVGYAGQVTFKSIQTLGVDSNLKRPALNAAPALSPDGRSVYAAFVDDSAGYASLVKLDAYTFLPQGVAHLTDPSDGQDAKMINESSASPMVGPDGHVFIGVFGYQWRESHGWMLQFDANLRANDSTGKRFPVGAFGWDDTPSVVASRLVPSYHGTSNYLILTKYNNYASATGDGVNCLAVLDPSKDDVTLDRQSGISVMNEVLKVTCPTPDPEHIDANHPHAVREWCINSAAIDASTKSAIVNCEDGYVYRWNFATNTLSEALSIQPATGEAYTSTIIGPDGTCYAINNSILHAIRAKA